MGVGVYGAAEAAQLGGPLGSARCAVCAAAASRARSADATGGADGTAGVEGSTADLKKALEDAIVNSSNPRASDSTEGDNKIASFGTDSRGFTASKSQALPTASIGAETTIESLSATNGLIALANSPELGLSPGTTVTIIKKLKSLGKVQVSQVTDDLVLANLLPGAKTREMVAGTTVSLLR